MKKFKNLVLLLAFFICFNGCERNQIDDSILPPDDELTIEKAKAFIEMQKLGQFALKSGNIQKQLINIRADWSTAKRSNNSEISVVETQIQAMGRFGFATAESMDAWKASKKEGYRFSLTKLVVIKVKKTGEIY